MMLIAVLRLCGHSEGAPRGVFVHGNARIKPASSLAPGKIPSKSGPRGSFPFCSRPVGLACAILPAHVRNSPELSNVTNRGRFPNDEGARPQTLVFSWSGRRGPGDRSVPSTTNRGGAHASTEDSLVWRNAARRRLRHLAGIRCRTGARPTRTVGWRAR